MNVAKSRQHDIPTGTCVRAVGETWCETPRLHLFLPFRPVAQFQSRAKLLCHAFKREAQHTFSSRLKSSGLVSLTATDTRQACCFFIHATSRHSCNPLIHFIYRTLSLFLRDCTQLPTASTRTICIVTTSCPTCTPLPSRRPPTHLCPPPPIRPFPFFFCLPCKSERHG